MKTMRLNAMTFLNEKEKATRQNLLRMSGYP
jgi:hypothetical protein